MHIYGTQTSLILVAVATKINFTAVNGFSLPQRPHSTYSHGLSKKNQRYGSELKVEAVPGEAEATPAETTTGRPKWMKCINGVARRSGPLNEAVSKVADVTLEQANDLIAIGAVWAKMDVLTEDEILDQYYGSNDNAKIAYADLPAGWHSDRYSREEVDEEDLDEFIARMDSMRYNRIMAPSTIAAGTDLRVYPFPRRFPACKDLDETKLLHEDTTFIIVDKPPLLPTQPDASNYFENCPGCVATNMGPFTNLAGDTVERPLLCHRVDSCVSGCVVLSKDENGQAVFSRLQRERKVKKVYKAVTKKPVPIGMHGKCL